MKSVLKYDLVVMEVPSLDYTVLLQKNGNEGKFNIPKIFVLTFPIHSPSVWVAILTVISNPKITGTTRCRRISSKIQAINTRQRIMSNIQKLRPT